MVSSPSEQQRQHLQNELTRAVGTGRIDIKQFDFLMGIVWSSDSMEVLQSIRRDYLGQGGPGNPGRPGPSDQAPTHAEPAPHNPAQAWQARSGQFSAPAPVKTTLGTINLTGRWTVPARQEFVASGGTIHIDLRQARADTPIVEFNINAKMSTVRIIAPPGVAVDNRMRNLASTVEMDNTIPHPQAPRVVLTGSISGCKLSVMRVPLRR